MPPQTDEETIQEIVEAWKEADDPSYNGISDEVGVHRDTVKRYVYERIKSDEEDPPEAGHVAALGPTPEEEGSLFTEPGADLAEDFEQFFTRLNDEHSIGIKSKAITMMASEIRNAQQLPMPSNVVSFLESTASGVNNAAEINWIGRQYDIWRQRYLETQTMGEGSGLAGQGSQGLMGGQGQRGQQAQPSVMGGQAQPQQQPPNQGFNPAMQMMFQQLQQQMEKMEQRLEQQQHGQSEDVLERKTQEFLEAKLEQLIEADTTEEQDAVIQELRALRAEMQDGGPGGGPPQEGDWRDKVLAATQSGNMDVQQAKELAEMFGGNEDDPRVLEKKYEKEIKEKELEHETGRAERIADTIEMAADRVGEGIGRQLTGGGSGETGTESTPTADGGTQAHPPRQEEAQPAESPATADQEPSVAAEPSVCPHCDTQMQAVYGGEFCPNCEYGIGQCDLCGFPIEVPPEGEAEFGRCGECENLLERPADSSKAVECDRCEWSGPGSELRGEATRCGNDDCGEIRPIKRAVDDEAMMEQLDKITGD